MAGDEQAKLDFTEILSNIDRKFDIIHAKWSEEKLFEIKFRTQIPRNSEDFNGLCDEWVDMFSEITNTVWVKKISNTGPKIRFRKQYQCWTHGGKEVQKELLFDSRRCKGTLDMKVLTDNLQSRKKNKHIKLGLNVVVKINFTHLHKVETLQRYSFFVHSCKPQPEPPKPNIHSNDNLPKLVAEMVQKGINSTTKGAPQLTVPANAPSQHIQINPAPHLLPPTNEINQNNQLIHNQMLGTQVHVQSVEPTYQLNQIVPVQGMDSIKLEVQPQFQQVTQVLVNESSLEMGEPILLCQPLMFDPGQVIPVTAHTLPSHFVQLHPHNIHNQQGHYL